MPKSDQERAEIRLRTEARRHPEKDRAAHENARGVKLSVPAGSLSKHLSRRELDDTELDVAMKEFQSGSDRVAAIMGSALVEHHLMETIRLALADAFDDNALFHDQGAPFGTFKARIVAGRGLGLYDEKIAHDLDIMRDIRNQFAHALMSLNFDNPLLVETCKKFSEPVVVDDNGTPFDYSNPGQEGASVTRQQWETMCWKLSIILLQKDTEILSEKSAKLERELARLQNPPQRNALAGIIAASIEGRDKDVENNVAPDKT